MTDCRIAIAGLGVVGAETARQLVNNRNEFAQKASCALTITAISARSRSKDRGFDMSSMAWCDNPVDLASRDDVDVVVELMGGSDGPALALCKAALMAGKHVVTANKAMIALHGAELARMAEDNGVQLLFESSVAGGIPALKILREGLSANQISSVSGILNGTCNYILSEMEQTGRSFDDVLKEAQSLGYAEADPTFDVDGIDAAHKLTILAALAYGRVPDFEGLAIEGIRQITDKDIGFAAELGYRIRLVGRATSDGHASVAPVLLPVNSALAMVTGPLNAVYYEADPVNTISAVGPGAGAGPTASAVLADIIDIAANRKSHPFGRQVSDLQPSNSKTETDFDAAFYLRLVVEDKSGVLASVTEVLKSSQISIETLVQKGREDTTDVDLVMISHTTSHSLISDACARLASVDAVKEVSLSLAVLA